MQAILSTEYLPKEKSDKLVNFQDLIAWLKEIPTQFSVSDFTEIKTHHRGSITAKHALIARIAEDQDFDELEFSVAIVMLRKEHFPDLFMPLHVNAIPVPVSFIKINGERYNLFYSERLYGILTRSIIREQRVEARQSLDWKKVIYDDYLNRWQKRNPEKEISLENIRPLLEMIEGS